MPTSHDDLLTPAELEAAQLMATLAWRLDGGQLISADQMLARLCSVPTNDVAMASMVFSDKSRTASHRRSSGHRSKSSIACAHGSPAERGRPTNVTPSHVQVATDSADVLPDCRYQAAQPRITLTDESAWTAPGKGAGAPPGAWRRRPVGRRIRRSSAGRSRAPAVPACSGRRRRARSRTGRPGAGAGARRRPGRCRPAPRRTAVPSAAGKRSTVGLRLGAPQRLLGWGRSAMVAVAA